MALSGRLFSWKNGVGVAELSDLPRPVEVNRRIEIISHKTGLTAAFVLSSIDYDMSGEDIYGYHYIPVDQDLKDEGVRILIIND